MSKKLPLSLSPVRSSLSPVRFSPFCSGSAFSPLSSGSAFSPLFRFGASSCCCGCVMYSNLWGLCVKNDSENLCVHHVHMIFFFMNFG
ncbi:hypothetical protein MtrunA17_Chr4g0007891 [Medicago truncatula]|uniref:Uncharacterized protein n=1 Tax=Medicago truncatula TaxID=3880 RepID=A0A396I7W8_MEDTR|nr:hypothetical protein MtrunA17_Chr4g0007871 [Medicago truncatula]RHN58949.1 hypothetical protein MtrunA17_Chr4g0007891 [Medicago truncatula]